MLRYISFIFIVTTSYASIITVPSDFANIQDAINYASSGDSILIDDGIYYEGLEIDKDITLMSHYINDNDESHIDSTIISGASVYNTIMITADGVSLNIIGLSVMESSDHGIHANSGTSDINLFTSHSEIYNNLGYGINFYSCYNISLEIKNSSIHSNSELGVHLSYSNGYIEAEFDSVKIYNNQEGGIFCDECENSSILVSNSEFFNQTHSAISMSKYGDDIPTQLEVNNSKFYENNKYINGQYGSSSQSTLISADYLVMRGVEFYDNDYFGVSCANTGIIKDSKFYNNIGWGSILSGTISSIEVYRTKFYNNDFSLWFGDSEVFYPSEDFFRIQNVRFYNCAIYDNTLGWGFISSGWGDWSDNSGIFYNAIVMNNTIAGGSFFQDIDEVWFYNSIFLDNTCENINANYSVSDVEILSGVNNITDEIILFLNDDFELDPESPCINAGIPVEEYNDLDGTRNDIGIYGGPYAYPVWGCMNPDACNYNQYCDSPYSPNECMFDDGSCIFPEAGFDCSDYGYLSIKPNLHSNKFNIEQNYPNPFNPMTTIRYELPEVTNVTISIYDMMGREVKNLINTNQNSGYKSVIWNGTNNNGEMVSGGMYFYFIKTNNFSQTRKMILLK